MVGEVDTNEMVSELRLFFDTKTNHQMERNLEIIIKEEKYQEM